MFALPHSSTCAVLGIPVSSSTSFPDFLHAINALTAILFMHSFDERHLSLPMPFYIHLVSELSVCPPHMGLLVIPLRPPRET